MIKPFSELCVSKILTIFLTLINLLSWEILFCGEIPECKIFDFIKVDEIFLVYFGSTSFPPHFLKY